MKWLLSALIIGGGLLIACQNVSGLDGAPRATFSELACLDKNGDNRLSAEDAADPSKLPDFNADRSRDEFDASFLQGVDIPLNPDRDKDCKGGDNPEYLVAHGYIDPSDVSCGDGDEAVLLLGVGGGVKNLKESGDAKGVRGIIDGLQKSFDGRDVQTIGVIAGQDVIGAMNGHAAMEQWLTHVVRVYVDRFPCLRVVLVGHSHGGVTVDVVASRLEGEYGPRFVAVVPVDRVEFAYGGDTAAFARAVPVFNVFQTNGPGLLRGFPRDAPNVENWDATALEDGDDKPIAHTTLDNAKDVKSRIIDEVIERSS